MDLVNIRKIVFSVASASIYIILTLPIFFLFFFENQGVVYFIKLFVFFNGKLPFIDPCWFFLTMFFVRIFIKAIKIDKIKMIYIAVMMTAFFVIGYFLVFVRFDYFGIGKFFIGSAFFMAGHLLRKIGLFEKTGKHGIALQIIVMVSAFIIWVPRLCIMVKYHFMHL